MAERRNAVAIPDKLYFRIGEVCKLTRTHAYVLRFWEKEFPMLKPVKSSTGHRMYRRKDVELVLEIKKLLYQEGFTIGHHQVGAEGAVGEACRQARYQANPRCKNLSVFAPGFCRSGDAEFGQGIVRFTRH